MLKKEDLYRGKHAQNKSWVYGDLFHVCAKVRPSDSKELFGGVEDQVIHCHTTDAMLAVKPETVGRCVGVADKKGALIFDGDIIACGASVSEQLLGLIKFEDYAWKVLVWEKDRQTSKNGLTTYDFSAVMAQRGDKIQVIGNKWDSYFLLRGILDEYTPKKEIHYYLGSKYPNNTHCSYLATKAAIEQCAKRGEGIVHTTQFSFIGDDRLCKGFKLFVHDAGGNVCEIKQEKKESAGHTTPPLYNLAQRLFDRDFLEKLTVEDAEPFSVSFTEWLARMSAIADGIAIDDNYRDTITF